MATTLITPPTALAVPLDLARANLRIDGTDMDLLITAWILGITAYAEHYMKRSIMQQGWRVTLDVFPPAIKLPMLPLLSVDAVRFLDVNGVQQTLDPQDYLIDPGSVDGYIVPGIGKAWPATQCRINAVTVDVTCGFAATADAVPNNIRLFILAKLVEQFDPMSTTQRDLKADTVQATFIDHLLDSYCTFSF